VRNILATTIEALKMNPARKFMYVEMYYFHKWWTDGRTTESQRNDLRTLLASGQWEFVMGGWVMPDEATTTYSAVLDQLVEGHVFLNKTFGIVPSIGWQIDPFGASQGVAAVYLKAGFKYHVLDRINWKQKQELIAKKSLEFRWNMHPDWSDTIFTHILDDNYCMPLLLGFDFEGNQVLNPPITDSNIHLRAQEYALLVRQRSTYYATKNVLVLHQCDFAYQNAHLQFDNMDQILKYINDHPSEFNMNIRWSRLEDYFKTIEKELPPMAWPYKDGGDFFGYDDNSYSWWSGYYTSRPGLKGEVRDAEAYLRFSDVLEVPMYFDKVLPDPELDQNLRRAVAVAQHHDAVAGTETEAVAQHYAFLLQQGKDRTMIKNEILLDRSTGQGWERQWTNSTDQLKNLQPGHSVGVLVFNSLFSKRTQVIKIPVWSWKDIQVIDAGIPIKRAATLPNLDPNDLAISPASLFVEVKDIPAAGWKMIYISRTNTQNPSIVVGTSFGINNQFLTVNVSSSTGLINGITYIGEGNQRKTIKATNNLMAYESFHGFGQPSGAYIFRPSGPASPLNPQGATTTIRITPFVQEIHQVFTNFASQTIRLYDGHDYADISNWIGPLPGNTELISRWSNGFDWDVGYLDTDGNGMFSVPRYYSNNHTLPIPANYYPSVYRAFLGNYRESPIMNFVHDRSHGVGVEKPGEMEIMLHRRLLQDDWRGVGEALNDVTVINPKHRLSLSDEYWDDGFRRNEYELNFPPVVFYHMGDKPYTGARSYAPLYMEPPNGFHIVLFRMIEQKKAIVTVTCVWCINDTFYDVRTLAPMNICRSYETNLTGVKKIASQSGFRYQGGDIRSFVIEFC
jgi:lysosomal alpha-mannosidase